MAKINRYQKYCRAKCIYFIANIQKLRLSKVEKNQVQHFIRNLIEECLNAEIKESMKLLYECCKQFENDIRAKKFNELVQI